MMATKEHTVKPAQPAIAADPLIPLAIEDAPVAVGGGEVGGDAVAELTAGEGLCAEAMAMVCDAGHCRPAENQSTEGRRT